ncbi:hypothetical protein CLIM01_03353 [Colletotrichum limetticola]|uniref:Uncharacterized protein n=1 Tax=Colletotrichum limetticola TaxID=1209924 RepID=A0ABQ9Q6C8_9PEZI|nr:hypothetical protein CLIM01_03353 [Colletotrichum limetticola]
MDQEQSGHPAQRLDPHSDRSGSGHTPRASKGNPIPYLAFPLVQPATLDSVPEILGAKAGAPP